MCQHNDSHWKTGVDSTPERSCRRALPNISGHNPNVECTQDLSSHTGTYEEFYLLACNACSPLKVNRRFGRTCRIHLQSCSCCFTSICYLTCSPTLKMKATRSFERPVVFHRTIWHYIPGDRPLLIPDSL
jgi:hypothetical protein